MNTSTKLVLDTCAVIAWLNEEAEAPAMEALIQQAKNGEADLMMNAVNKLEVRYGYLNDLKTKKITVEKYNDILYKFSTLPVSIIRSIDDALIEEAARIKSAYSCALGDAIGAATAIVYGGQFVTKDRGDFSAIDEGEPELVKWLS